MTLLSIREQEGFPDHFPCSTHGKCETCERDRKVILATRDAIARQVRDRANGGPPSDVTLPVDHVIGWGMGVRDAATFIEDLRCE